MRISDWSSDVCSSDRPHRFFRDICSYGKDRFPKQRLCRAGQVSDNSNNLKAGCGGSWRLFNDVGQKVAQAITLIICQLVDRVGKLHYAVNPALCPWIRCATRSEEHTSELQSLMRNSYAVFCLTKKKYTRKIHNKD